MIIIETVRERVGAAASREEALTSCMDAFGLIERICGEYAARRESELYPAWMSAIAPACNGRRALGASLPRDPDAGSAESDPDGTREDEIAGRLAVLAAALRDRLQEITGQAADLPLQQACQRGIAAAEEIRLLLDADG